MPAYAVAHLNDVDTTHPDIAEYLHRIDATLAEFGGRFLVHGQPQTAVEGTGWAIVVEFPDHTAARAWYDSPRYQAIVPLRRAHSSGAVVIADYCGDDHVATDALAAAPDGAAARDDNPDPAALMPFAGSLGIRFTETGRDRVVGTMSWSRDKCTAGDILHGGALMSLADSVGALCAHLNLPPDASTSTIESKTNFVRGVRAGQMTATARPVHVGGRTIVVQTEITDSAGKLVALVTATQAVIAARPAS